jgi:hypothetical protein
LPHAPTAVHSLARGGEGGAAELLVKLNQRAQPARLAAIYALAAAGAPAVPALLADLAAWHSRPDLLMQGDSGALKMDNDPARHGKAEVRGRPSGPPRRAAATGPHPPGTHQAMADDANYAGKEKQAVGNYAGAAASPTAVAPCTRAPYVHTYTPR